MGASVVFAFMQVNVTSKRCAEEGCQKLPSFNFPNEGALYCKAHRKPGMVS